MPVIMGRKTYESFNKLLPGRFNFVITRQTDWKAEGAVTAANLTEALQKAAETNCREFFVIGGGEIYKEAIEIANKIYITRVHASFDADTFFPQIVESKWQLVTNQDFGVDEKHKYAYSFQVWERK